MYPQPHAFWLALAAWTRALSPCYTWMAQLVVLGCMCAPRGCCAAPTPWIDDRAATDAPGDGHAAHSLQACCLFVSMTLWTTQTGRGCKGDFAILRFWMALEMPAVTHSVSQPVCPPPASADQAVVVLQSLLCRSRQPCIPRDTHMCALHATTCPHPTASAPQQLLHLTTSAICSMRLS